MKQACQQNQLEKKEALYKLVRQLTELPGMVGFEKPMIDFLRQPWEGYGMDICEDGLAAIVEFQNGVVKNPFQISPGSPALRSWETMMVDTQGMLRSETGKSLEVGTTRQSVTQEYSYGFDHFIAQARDFVGVIIQDRAGEDGRQSLGFALALHRSAELGRPVKVIEMYEISKRREDALNS